MQNNGIKIAKKRIALLVALFSAFCFIFIYITICNTGVIKGLDPDIDEDRAKLISIEIEDSSLEGPIVDRWGTKITEAEAEGEPARVIDDECFSFLVGYNSFRYGKSGLRANYYNELFNGGKDRIGAQLKLTLDADLQAYAYYEVLGNHVGSVSVFDVDTGEILCLAGRSNETVGYNVNTIAEEIDEEGTRNFDVYNELDAFWYNRAIMAQDPPGSTFKIVTSASMIENGMQDYEYYDDGEYKAGNAKIVNAKGAAFGQLDLQNALINSANTYFASAGAELGSRALKATSDKYLIGTPIYLDFTTLKSNIDFGGLNNQFLISSTAYGQGRLVISPLHIAMITQSVMSEGPMIRPYLIENITDDGKVLMQHVPDETPLSETILPEYALELKSLLHENALNYGFDEEEYGYVIAKTGTAEIQDGELNHVYITFATELNGKRYAACIDYTNMTGMFGVDLVPKAQMLIDAISDMQNTVIPETTEEEG